MNIVDSLQDEQPLLFYLQEHNNLRGDPLILTHPLRIIRPSSSSMVRGVLKSYTSVFVIEHFHISLEEIICCLTAG